MKQTLIIVVLAILTVGSFLLMRGLQKELATEVNQQPMREIATAHQVSAKYFNANNQLQYTLTSEKVSEYSKGGGTRLHQPNFQAFDNKQQLTWSGTSKSAELSADKHHAALVGQVVITESPQGIKPIYIYSDRLDYDAQKNQIKSPVPVKVTDGLVNQTANQLLLDLNQQRVKLSGGVQAHYETVTIAPEPSEN